MNSYPKIYAIGHRAILDLFRDPVLVEEKIDGSQLSFGLYDGELKIKSKGALLNLAAPEGMFQRAVDTCREIAPLLHPGWTYRGEYLSKPKHNVLCYERTPAKFIILFDIMREGAEDYLPRAEKEAEAARVGLEVVPVVFQGRVESVEMLRGLLDTVSVLGKQKVEGVVCKNYSRFGIDGKPLMGKFVSEEFKETHAAEWKSENPSGLDVVGLITQSLRTPARWAKAVQHLKEAGKLEQSPRDIGPLIAEVKRDIKEECRDEITERLLSWALPHILRGAAAGLPEWYKDRLLKEAFTSEAV